MAKMCRLTDLICANMFKVPVPRTTLGVFKNLDFSRIWRDNANDAYVKHIEMVKRVTPKDRLLVFGLGEGWEPLCKFLDKEVPDMPFPRVNEMVAAQAMIKLYIAEVYRRKMVKLARQVAPIVGVVLVAYICLMR